MSRTRSTAIVVALATVLAGGTAQAQGFVFTPVKSVYMDVKEVALKAPEGVACSEAGAVAVADTGNGRLVLFTLKEGVLIGGTEVKLPQVTYPTLLQYDSKGNLLVLDRKTKRIARVDPKGAFAGFFEVKAAAAASLVVTSFKLDAADHVYVLDGASGKVIVADAAGTVLRTLPPPKEGPLFTDIAVDAAGTLFAIDAVDAALWAANKDESAFKPLTKSMKDRMNFPTYLSADRRGRLLVIDQHGNGIVVLGADGSYQGRQLATGWAEGGLYYPSQLCSMASGDTLIADRSNNRVQLFSAK